MAKQKNKKNKKKNNKRVLFEAKEEEFAMAKIREKK